MPDLLLIVGASVRAAAQSAVRGGLPVIGADLFADQDVRQLGHAVRVGDYPAQLPSIARRSGATWAMYTGALENHPRVVDQIGESCRLLGNTGAVLREVRDPVRLHATLREAGLPTPLTTNSVEQADGRLWLRKPIHSCGGSRIEKEKKGSDPFLPRRNWYYQQYIAGIAHAGAYLATDRDSLLLGVTRQLVGCDWLGAAGFAYCGSIGPVSPPTAQLTEWQEIGQCLVERFGLRGLFGVDAVVADDRVWSVEVNPRYTASMEVIERARFPSLVALHVRACLENKLPTAKPLVHGKPQIFGKAVVFADRDVAVSREFLTNVTGWSSSESWPLIADIPNTPETISLGRPVVTIFSDGANAPRVEDRLQTTAHHVRSLLHN